MPKKKDNSVLAIENMIKMLSQELSDSQNYKKYLAKRKETDEDGAAIESPFVCTLDILDIDRIKQTASILESAIKMKSMVLLEAETESKSTGVVILPDIKVVDKEGM